MLLTAAAYDLYISYLNQPIEVAELRPKVAGLIGEENTPQLILRLGYASEDVKKTPRRPVYEVLMRNGKF